MANIEKLKRSDPFDLPKSMVPIGLTYQWQAETIRSEIDPHFQKMLDRGWVAVPAQWHRPWFDAAEVPDGPVKIQGQVLLCHHGPVDEEAEGIAGAQRNVENWAKQYGGFSGGVRIQGQGPQGAAPLQQMRIGVNPALREALAPEQGDWRLPSQQKIETMPPQQAAIMVTPKIAVRIPRHHRLAWLFNLISLEQTS